MWVFLYYVAADVVRQAVVDIKGKNSSRSVLPVALFESP